MWHSYDEGGPLHHFMVCEKLPYETFDNLRPKKTMKDITTKIGLDMHKILGVAICLKKICNGFNG